jgi:hypothetical protein
MKTTPAIKQQLLQRTLPITQFCRTFHLARSTVWRAMERGDLRWVSLGKGKKRLVIVPSELCAPPAE